MKSQKSDRRCKIEQEMIRNRNFKMFKIFAFAIEMGAAYAISKFFTEFLFSYYPKLAHNLIINVVFIILLIQAFTWLNKKIGIR
jgi:hypothetical protein